MGCSTCGAETRPGSDQCPACASASADRWRAANRRRSNEAAHTPDVQAHQHWWWQRRLQESRDAHSTGIPSVGSLYALASHHRELRAHEGVLWGLVALLAVGSIGVIRVQLQAGGLEQAIWALAAFAAGVLGAEIAGERESVLRMLVIGPIGVVLVGVVAVAVESGAIALAIAMPALSIGLAVAAHLSIRRRRESAPVARHHR